jgi:hypothetical protein
MRRGNSGPVRKIMRNIWEGDSQILVDVATIVMLVFMVSQLMRFVMQGLTTYARPRVANSKDVR